MSRVARDHLINIEKEFLIHIVRVRTLMRFCLGDKFFSLADSAHSFLEERQIAVAHAERRLQRLPHEAGPFRS